MAEKPHVHLEDGKLIKFILKEEVYTRHHSLKVMALAAVGSDPFHINGPSCKTPKELLEAYGILHDDDYGRSQREDYKLDPTRDSPSLMVWLVLDKAKSWGEFLGGVIASWPLWTEDERDEVYPALMRGCQYAVEVGVDS
jgi:hypothetical protein